MINIFFSRAESAKANIKIRRKIKYDIINNWYIFADLYLRRFRKEKKWRRKLQEQLEVETKKIQVGTKNLK